MDDSAPPKVYEILKNVVNGDIDDYSISVHDPNKKGEGYLGQMFFVSLKDKRNGKEWNLVVKQAFAAKNIRDSHPIRDVFLNETFFYTKLWPVFRKFQETIPAELSFRNLPKCYAAATEENHERLVFKNLKFDGFVMHEKSKPLEREKFEMIFKVYGRLHAISFALKALRPETFSELTAGLLDVWKSFTEKQHFIDIIRRTHECCLENLQPGQDDEIIEKYKRYVEDGLEIYRNGLLVPEYAAITHGDCWSNNMMFKYDNSGKLKDVKFLDFQLARLGSPVCDLSYAFYSGGTKELFDDLDHFLRIYHDSLSESLKAYGCDAEELYPFKVLKGDWKQFCQMGFAIGLIIWKGKLTYEEEAVDLTDIGDNNDFTEKFFDSKYDEETFSRRVRDVLTHLYENDYLI